MSTRIRRVTWTVLLAVNLTACAEKEKPTEFDGCNWVTYTEEDGLLDNGVTAITFEENGVVWAGSLMDGVSRFDGDENWEIIVQDSSLSWNYIHSLATDQDGVIWVGATAGVGRYDPTNQSWEYFKEVLGSDFLTVAPDGTIWFEGGRDLVSFNGSEWNTYPIGDRLVSAAVADDDSVWVGTLGDGIIHIDPQGQQTRYTIEDGLPGSNVRDIAVAPDQTVWAAINGGAAYFDGEEWIVYTEELVSTGLSSVTFTPDGAVWFGSYQGVSRFDGTNWTLWPMDNVSVYDTYIETAPDGSVWFGTDIGLIHCE